MGNQTITKFFIYAVLGTMFVHFIGSVYFIFHSLWVLLFDSSNTMGAAMVMAMSIVTVMLYIVLYKEKIQS